MSNFHATSATNLYDNGVDTATIAYLLGRTSDAVTKKYFIRPTKEVLVQKIDEASFRKRMTNLRGRPVLRAPEALQPA